MLDVKNTEVQRVLFRAISVLAVPLRSGIVECTRIFNQHSKKFLFRGDGGDSLCRRSLIYQQGLWGGAPQVHATAITQWCIHVRRTTVSRMKQLPSCPCCPVRRLRHFSIVLQFVQILHRGNYLIVESNCFISVITHPSCSRSAGVRRWARSMPILPYASLATIFLTLASRFSGYSCLTTLTFPKCCPQGHMLDSQGQGCVRQQLADISNDEELLLKVMCSSGRPDIKSVCLDPSIKVKLIPRVGEWTLVRRVCLQNRPIVQWEDL